MPPETASPFRLPELPAEFLPAGAVVSEGEVYVGLIGNSEVDGYAEAKTYAPEMVRPTSEFWNLQPGYHAVHSYSGGFGGGSL